MKTKTKTKYQNRGGEIWEHREDGWHELFAGPAIERLERLDAKVEYAKCVGLNVATGTSTDCPDGRLQHDYTDGSELGCIFSEWSESIGWEHEREILQTKLATMTEALRFYADISKYPSPFTGGMGKLYFDCGAIAREALGE